MAVGCLFGCLCYTCLYNALTYFYRMQAAGGSAGTYQAGSSEAVKKFEAEMVAYTDCWGAGVVSFPSLGQILLPATSLQVCVVCVLSCLFIKFVSFLFLRFLFAALLHFFHHLFSCA